MSTAEQKAAARAAKKTAATGTGPDGGATAAGGEVAQQGGEVAQTDGGAAGGDQAGGDGPAQPAAPAIDPALAAAARAANVDLAGMDAEDIEDLRRALATDQKRQGGGPARTGRNLVQETTGKTSPHGISLMLEACDIYGVDPSADKAPRELLAWKFYPGEDDPARGVTPDAVVIVTGGGLKLRHYDDDAPGSPKDPDTVDKLRRAFGLFKQDPKTKEVIVLPLPGDLTLPAATVNGVGHTDHQYVGGYVQSGGKSAAAAKDQRRAERARRLGLQS